MNKPIIYWIKRKSYTGGAAYDSFLEQVLREHYTVKIMEHPDRDLNGRSLLQYYISRVYYRIRFIIQLIKINLNTDIKIRDFTYTYGT